MSDKNNRFQWRAFTSTFISLAFVILVISGAILFLAPPGRIADWTNWKLAALTKHQWIALHIWFSTVFLVVSIIHIILNFRPLVSYFKDRLTHRMGLRREWVAALVLCAGIAVGTLANLPPFSSLMAANEGIKTIWEKPQERAPIPHAELLTLAELAQKAGVEFVLASNRLAAAGVSGISSEVVVKDLAAHNQRSAQQVFDLLATQPAGVGQGMNNGGGSAGAGHGGGLGQKTLKEFCAGEGLDLSATIKRLAEKNIQATPEKTLREIAVENGFTKPYEMVELLRGKAQ